MFCYISVSGLIWAIREPFDRHGEGGGGAGSCFFVCDRRFGLFGFPLFLLQTLRTSCFLLLVLVCVLFLFAVFWVLCIFPCTRLCVAMVSGGSTVLPVWLFSCFFFHQTLCSSLFRWLYVFAFTWLLRLALCLGGFTFLHVCFCICLVGFSFTLCASCFWRFYLLP